MRKQYQIWKKEHNDSKALPSLGQDEPSEAAKYFTDFLKSRLITLGKALDIGCGKGRNAIFLAEKGYKVYGFDYIESAIEYCRKLATKYNLQNKIDLKVATMDQPWPYQDDYFDISLDCFSSIDIETERGRKKYKAELWRTLKPGGYVMVSVVSANDEFEAKMIKESPGPERNSTIWPQNGKFQKDYDKDELLMFYDRFEKIELKEVKKQAFKLGIHYTATNYWLILRKPNYAQKKEGEGN